MTCAYCGEEVEGIKNDEGLVVDTKHNCDKKSLKSLLD